jgi:TFIIF-interacting CTD phosphatase-like protein
MLTNLKVIYEMLEKINQSSFDKEDILRTQLTDPIFGKTLRKVLDYITDDKRTFSVKKISYCVYFDDKLAAENQNVDGIFEMLDYISGKTSGISDEEISFLEKISSPDVETVEVVMRILNKQSGSGLTNDQIIKILKEA